MVSMGTKANLWALQQGYLVSVETWGCSDKIIMVSVDTKDIKGDIVAGVVQQGYCVSGY